MPFRHGKNTALWLGPSDIGVWFTEVSTPQKADTADATTFGSTAKEYLAGQPEASVSAKGLWDGAPEAIDVQLAAALDADTGRYFTHGLEGPRAGGAAKLMHVRASDYELTTPVTDVVSITATLQGDGPTDTGHLLTANTTWTATATGAPLDSGTSTTGGAVTHLHLTGNTRTSASTVRVQHSADATTWADLTTFTTVPAGATATERVLAPAGTLVNRYVRAQGALGAGGGEITVTVAFARRR